MSNVYQQDCREGLKRLPKGSARLIFADPPYNLSGNGHQTVHAGRLVKCNKGDWDTIQDIDAFNREWVTECKRVLADDGTLWISGTLHNHPSIGCVLKELGFWIVNDVIWFKRNAPPLRTCNRLVPSTELIWVASKSKKYFFNYALAREINGGKQMRNLWEIPASRHLTPHPTEKPESLLKRIVSIASEAGDLVVDPFTGSGTTGAIAKRYHRKFVGFETDATYLKIAKERINKENPEAASYPPHLDKSEDRQVAMM